MLKGTLWGVDYIYEENGGLWQARVLNQQVGGITHSYMLDEVSKTIMIEALKSKGFIKNGDHWVLCGVKIKCVNGSWSAGSVPIDSPADLDVFPLWLKNHGFKRDGSCWVGHGIAVEKGLGVWKVFTNQWIDRVSNPEQIRKYMIEEVLKANGFTPLRSATVNDKVISSEWTRDGLRVYFDGEVWRIVLGHKALPISDVKELERYLKVMENVLKANGFKLEGTAWIRGDLRVVFQGAWAIYIGGKRLTLTDAQHLESYLKAIERSEPKVKITEYANGILVESLERVPNHVALVQEIAGMWYMGGKSYRHKEPAIDAAKEKVLC